MSAVSRNRLIGLALALVVFVLDRWVKGLMLGPLDLRNQPGGHIELLPFFDLTWTENYGVSLGMFTANSDEARWVLVGVTALIALVVLIWMMREKALADILALALVLGGAAGNIRDRSLYGYVIDYADFHIGTFRPFLIFNIADAAITIGVLIILARSLFMREKRNPTSDTPAQDEPAAPKADRAAETN